MGRCSLLMGLRSSSQSSDQLALTFIELLRISWQLRGAFDVFDVICIEVDVCCQVAGKVIDVDDK